MKRALTIEVERSGSWRGARTVRRGRVRPKGEPPMFTRPIRGTVDSGAFIARTNALPLGDGSVSAVTCFDVLEYVRNDDCLIEEIARVIEPGGTVRLRVPATGPLAGFDSYNLMHYLVDTTRRGLRPMETSELGWRRHYSPADLADLLGAGRFRVTRVRRRRLAIAELIRFAGMALFRWLRPSLNGYRRFTRLARAIERFEDRIVTPIGFLVEIDAIRLHEIATA